MKKDLIGLAAALCLCFAGSAFAADNAAMSKDAHKAAKDKIEAQYKADKAACDGMNGNAKDLCKADAKGKEKIAKAELEAQYQPSPKADEKVKLAKADAAYDVAKEKCDDMKGNAKDVCKKEAKAAHTKAKADAKANAKVSEVRKDAAADARDANYAVAKEKCDALAGDAKTRCIDEAKARFGKS